MATTLTDAEKLTCKEILGIRFDSTSLDYYFSQFTINEDTRIRQIISSYEDVSLDSDKIKAKGLDSDPARQKTMLKNKLAIYFGVDPYNIRLHRI